MGSKGFTGHFTYLLVVVGCCLVPCLAVLALTTTGYYVRHSSYFFDVEGDHSFNVHDQNADILLIGDSSLLTGVMPREIARQTGLSVYSQPVSAPVFAVFPDVPAALTDRYLAHNKRPRLILLYLAPGTRAHAPFAKEWKWYEGEALLMRYGKPLEIIRYFASHPERVIPFIVLAGDRIHHRDASGGLYRDVNSKLDEGEGFFSVPQSVLDSTRCTRSPLTPDRELLEGFRRMAAQRGIAAEVYLAPLPDCDRTFVQTASNFSHLIDNVPYTLATRQFLNDDFLAHLNMEGAEQNSQLVGAFLKRISGMPEAAGSSP